jgi:broad specificity phosphatase PhoE
MIEVEATRLILVRHGLTRSNEEYRLQGSSNDSGLSPRGKKQAEEVATCLAGERIEAIYSSDLTRAMETAIVIAAPHGLTVVPEPRLRELHLGLWDGMLEKDVQERYAFELSRWQTNMTNEAPPGGESFGQLAERVEEAWREIAARHPRKAVVLIGHYFSLQAILCTALDLRPLDHMPFFLAPGCISELRVHQGKAILYLLNSISHIRQGA